MALTIAPVALKCNSDGSSNLEDMSIIACVVTNLLGDTKGEWYSNHSSELLAKVHSLVSWPDTKVFLYNTTSSGEHTGPAFAMITQSAYYDLEEIDNAQLQEARG